MPGRSRLAHPAPLPVGCGYAGVCRSTLVLPARRGASTPRGTAWSQPGAGSTPLLPGSCRGTKGSGSPVPSLRLPEPARARPVATQAAPGAQACASSISLLVAPRGRAKLGPCPARFGRPFLSGAFTGRQPQFPKGPSPTLTLRLRLLLRQLPSFTPKLFPAVATSIAIVVASLSKHLRDQARWLYKWPSSAVGKCLQFLPAQTRPSVATPEGPGGTLPWRRILHPRKGVGPPAFPALGTRLVPSPPAQEGRAPKFGSNKLEQTKLSEGERGGTFSALVIIP